jgi:CheY-like chemotaxis protein
MAVTNGERTIVIVEDERIVAEDLRIRLQRLHYTVSAMASSGEEAMQKTEETRPDLVLMDIKLQGDVDGVEAAAYIQSHYHIPIIFLTAYADEDILQRAKKTTPYGYILKPFDEQELRIAIEMALYRHKREREREQLIQQRQDALSHVKTLRGLLPICAHCKRIRDDRGYWQSVERYIGDHSEADFSHSVCPECMKSMYPEIIGDAKEQKRKNQK